LGKPLLYLGIVQASIYLFVLLLDDSMGVFLGAPKPKMELASYPATNSPIAGMSGSVSERDALVIPSCEAIIRSTVL
jgi:hypothetical protein